MKFLIGINVYLRSEDLVDVVAWDGVDAIIEGREAFSRLKSTCGVERCR